MVLQSTAALQYSAASHHFVFVCNHIVLLKCELPSGPPTSLKTLFPHYMNHMHYITLRDHPTQKSTRTSCCWNCYQNRYRILPYPVLHVYIVPHIKKEMNSTLLNNTFINSIRIDWHTLYQSYKYHSDRSDMHHSIPVNVYFTHLSSTWMSIR